jgi:hypothetical protein
MLNAHNGEVPQWPLWDKQPAYWHRNQIVITYHSPKPHPAMANDAHVQESIDALKLDELYSFLQRRGIKISSFQQTDMPYRTPDKGSEGKGEANRATLDTRLTSRVGKHLFRSPSGQGSVVVCFFNVELDSTTSFLRHEAAARGNSQTDMAPSIISLINNNLDRLRQGANIPIVAAMPNWLKGATPDGGGDGGSYGCPTCPPLPVPDKDICSPGRWLINLPELSPHLQECSGDGVTVFVLDTIPKAEQVISAAALFGANNLQLKDFANQIGKSIVIHHQVLPDRLDVRPMPATGDDVYGRLVGFEMQDHGLFVAGIIHDIAPKARIECVRALNDYGVGDVGVLCHALENIQQRMDSGELKHVVINLSLVTTPHDEQLFPLWFGNNCCPISDVAGMAYEAKLLRAPLHLLIKGLTARGAVIVASAGNGSDANPRHRQMTTQLVNMPTRLGPRYPAAFPETISVGAVTSAGVATTYSDYPAMYPQYNGIATHGGDLPIPKPALPDPAKETEADVNDPVCGLYSAATFPALSAEDMHLDRPNPPIANKNGWAYWSGTSFATPIISGVAARVLESSVTIPQPHLSAHVQWAITQAEGQQKILTGGAALPTASAFGANVGVLKAVQTCQPEVPQEQGTASEPVPVP